MPLGSKQNGRWEWDFHARGVRINTAHALNKHSSRFSLRQYTLTSMFVTAGILFAWLAARLACGGPLIVGGVLAWSGAQ